MKKLLTLGLIAAIICAAISCKKTPTSSSGKTVTLEMPDTTTAYFSITTSGNVARLNRAAMLGRVLFYDQHLSVNNTVACASCHNQQLAFADNARFSRGFENRLTGRNSMPIENLGLVTSDSFFRNGSAMPVNLFWDGRSQSITDLVLRPVTNHVEMGIAGIDQVPGLIEGLPYYPQLFTDAFGDASISAERISLAIGAFMSSINPSNTRFDQMTNEQVKFNALEEQGMLLFHTKYPCGNCHNTTMPPPGGYSGNLVALEGNFADIGLDETYTDKGRGVITGRAEDNGKFRTPNLRNVALTAPYMHDGRFNTLDEVLDHYSHGIANSANLDMHLRTMPGGSAMQMNISEQEKQAIIAFLNTLTDYDMITDPKFSNPFKIQ